MGAGVVNAAYNQVENVNLMREEAWGKVVDEGLDYLIDEAKDNNGKALEYKIPLVTAPVIGTMASIRLQYRLKEFEEKQYGGLDIFPLTEMCFPSISWHFLTPSTQYTIN